MLKNYLKTALRNLWRYKGFAFINILSLTIGIVGCLVIALFVWDEKQYDKFLPQGENIYRIYEQRNEHNIITKAACVPPAFASFIKHEYPEVEVTARILMTVDNFLLETEDRKGYEDKGLIVDSTFFRVFPVSFSAGDIHTALNDPSSVVISEDIAKRYFGKQDPLGKTMKIDKSNRVVKAVFKKLPEHFHLKFEYLMPMAAAEIPKERMEKWTWHQFYTYVKLKPGSDAQLLQDKFQAYVKENIFPTYTQSGSTFLPFFQPLKDIYLKSADFGFDIAVRGNQTSVNALSLIAVFVLIIACFNFINLSTARSFRRAKEIGVRKVVGADRKQLIIQFIGETILLAVFSMILATIITLFIIPSLNQFAGKAIGFNPFTNPILALAILAAGIFIGMLAGIYPAMVLSGFKPISVLKNIKVAGSLGNSWLRHALVVIQFALSVLLIVSTIIVYRQANYLNEKDLGFNKEQVVYFQLRDSLETNAATLETFKQTLKSFPGIVSVTSGYGLPGDRYAGDGITLPAIDGEKRLSSNVFIGDHDYVKTLGLRIVAGRDFSREMSTDETEAFLINEFAVKEWGFGTPEKALGQPINWDEWAPKDTAKPVKRGRIIGVVQDFHYKSLHEKVAPSVIQLYPQVTFKLAAKIKPGNLKEALAFIGTTWAQFVPAYPLDYKFMDDTYGAMYKSEAKLSQLLWVFTIMAIFIGCMGLFALAAFSAEQRTKEIGIRKVLGANLFNIIGLLSKSFLILVFISALLAFPIAWWAMNSWLKDFPYRVNLSWWIFGISLVCALAIAFITVSFQSIKAATVNPVKSLRSE